MRFRDSPNILRTSARFLRILEYGGEREEFDLLGDASVANARRMWLPLRTGVYAVISLTFTHLLKE